MTPGAFDRLVALLKRLPGIGEKSARRMAFFFIQQPQAFASDFIEALNDAKRNIRQCSLCGTITDTDPCPICSDPMRDRTSVLVVETVEDLVNIEGTGVFGGVYHVLGERVSPLTGDDLSEKALSFLQKHLRDLNVREVIVATNPRIEGELTYHAILGALDGFDEIRITKLACGLPIGGSIEFADRVTLHAALDARVEIRSGSTSEKR